MAAKIVVGLATYLEDFTNGQVGFRTPPYVEYTTDLDTDFLTLRTTINLLIDEVAAVQGPNAGLGKDILIFDDPARAGGTMDDGLIGIGSYLTVIGAPTSELDVSQGAALISGTKVQKTTPTTLVGSGLAGTYFIALDTTGFPVRNASAGLSALDIYSAVWNGAAWTSVT
ncbi:MAG: hypothetical protein ACRDTJ_00090, partial [Pseudonocardiaceae bacterium]